ncbi:putative capsular polysaccharide synthesis family protein [Aquimarina sp. 2201CG5-10]|uniref:putative capsular polysaccharide synthesis family protein n=1 Tax=Aquimarina callyspongiae TaxID=3098150 RepID=UPI002AB4D8D3|nr:putative capsular polysaccharide synthesis family protein [Aquimarina sp. 2201CG5-10]MDY8138864.1 putative capsular polysaccharide synthesis family protein [Aquimarina sp. 2201CG5-10]
MKNFLKYYTKDRLVLAYKEYQLKRIKNVEPILVFTMAKVGSSSVYSSLKRCTNIPTFHIHSLDEEEANRNIKLCFDHGVYPGSRTPVFLINKEVIEKNKPYKIISLFRNPIERNISAFFEAFQYHTGSSIRNYTGSILDLEKIYHKRLLHFYPIEWYDKQFKDGTGINVFDLPFDKEKGYLITKYKDTELLLINSSLNDKIKETTIRDFCRVEHFELKNINVTEKSNVSLLYTEFKNKIRFSEEYLSCLLDTKYMNHFFPEKEKERLFNKWVK